jgi:hypothetical protein
MNRARQRLILLGCLFAFVYPACAQEHEVMQPVILTVDHTSAGFVYEVDGKTVSRSLSQTLMSTLVGKLSKEPKPTPMIVLVHDRATLQMVGDIRGFVTKIGYDLPQVFWFNQGKTSMIELKFAAKAVAFSARGNAESHQ